MVPKDSESLKILDIRLREVGAKRRLNGTSKVNRQTDRRTDTQTDRHTDGQTHRRTFQKGKEKEGAQKDLSDLLELSPEKLQKIELDLNPHELMEQIHYRLKANIISYSIAKQKPRKREKTEIETVITNLNESLNTEALDQEERLEKKGGLQRKNQ